MAQAKSRTRAAQTFSVGDRGKNRVRVFFRKGRGFYVEFSERPEGGGKRPRLSLGTFDRDAAKAKAEALAVELRTNAQSRARPVAFTLAKLFELTEGLSTEKGESKRKHDVRCREMFCRYWGASREVSTLSVTDWNAFIRDRRKGVIAPAKAKKGQAVRNRVIEYDLRFLLSALRLATITPDGRGGTLLARNPLQGLSLPKEESPTRPTLSAEDYGKVLAVADAVHPDFKAMLVVAHETGHRMASVRTLRWSDLDLERGRVHWRAEHDKIGFAHTTPLTEETLRVLHDRQRALVARQKVEGVISDAWVFPGDRRASEPRSRQTVMNWWRKACTEAKLPHVARRGFHSLRRAFATDLKDTNLRDLAHLGGWRSPQTLLTVYQQPDEETQRAALAKRRSVQVVNG